MGKDPHFKAIRNEGPTRLGHTILYDRLVNEVATHDICMIYHADMYLCPGALDAIEKHLTNKTIVSLTRIEPPLHPDGPEKCIWDCGIEPEEFDEDKLLKFVKGEGQVFKFPEGHTTEGIFAPWAFWKKDFQEIGGHDPIFAPQSKEDTDIFNRFHLNGIKFIQTWNGFVYHMTCRGSRFADGAKRNPDGQVFMKNRETDEWLAQNQKSTREFIRKWGHFCKHDQYMKPIVPPKYEIGIVVENCYYQLIQALEPWCDYIYVDLIDFVLYSEEEQKYSSFNIDERVKGFDPNKHVIKDNVTVKIDGNKFTQQDMQLIGQLSEIIQDNGEVGEFELGNLKIQINDLTTYENNLIICD